MCILKRKLLEESGINRKKPEQYGIGLYFLTLFRPNYRQSGIVLHYLTLFYKNRHLLS